MRWAMIISLIFSAVFIFTAVAVAIFVTETEKSQYSRNADLLEKYAAATPGNPTTVVIVFSRSGNTHLLANHIAALHNADIKVIKAKDYALGIPGWIQSLYDARTNIAAISPDKLNLSQYDTVYLGAPIWLYSPAPPIWEFAKNNVFTGKDVVLFNTFNSKFEARFIEAFKALAIKNGATSFTHQAVKRGRMGSQLSAKAMLETYDKSYR